MWSVAEVLLWMWSQVLHVLSGRLEVWNYKTCVWSVAEALA